MLYSFVSCWNALLYYSVAMLLKIFTYDLPPWEEFHFPVFLTTTFKTISFNT